MGPKALTTWSSLLTKIRGILEDRVGMALAVVPGQAHTVVDMEAGMRVRSVAESLSAL